MRSGLKIILPFVLMGMVVSCGPANTKVESEKQVFNRTVENFGSNWEFQRLEDSLKGWETVNIPHTVKIEPLVVNDQWQGIARYRKTIDITSLNDQKWFLHFEGVMQEARVFINGKAVHRNKGGYLPFTVDATSHLKPNISNIIEVEVVNVDDTSIPPGKVLKDLDFNLYGGIYRNVQLIKTNKIYITDAVRANIPNGGGILVHFDSINKVNASGLVKTHIRNESGGATEIMLRTTFTSGNGNKYEIISEGQKIEPRRDLSISQRVEIQNPELWSPSSPELYSVLVEVLSEGMVIDSWELRTGIRDIKLTGEGFYLNGEKLFINGTNRHQEYPYVGYALSDEAQYRDAYKIKEAGFNFVRLSHYPHATAFMEACDELGLLVMNAIPGWQYFEEGQFVENAIQDIRDLARRDRNHPSVVFWENSLNESDMPEEFMFRANQVLKAELPYKDIFTAGWIDHRSYDLFIPARQHAKPPHYWNRYSRANRPILIAEYGDWEYYAQNAGFNQSAFSDLQEEERTSRQLRGAGEARLLQQALNYQEAFNSNLKGSQTIGHSNWLMFDYNRGYADDLEASGISDIFRIPKFSFYFYKSQKGPADEEFSGPMVYIANYWPAESTTSVKVFSNTEEVGLYLNGKLVERRKPDSNEFTTHLPHPPFTFELDRFVPGELRAIGYSGGREVATHIVRTPESPVKLVLEADISGKNINTVNPDMIFVYAKIVDGNGTLVPDAANTIEFSVEGSQYATIIGGSRVNAEAGIATILLRTESFTGPLKIITRSSGLGESSIILNKK
ncbi:MAG TPA: glycoside hydrolase family 2 TIM barrel-domain containing protein [Gillisia sp.]|nr:glycoside hydrolase family 2 TIM barrel-domain containing protein [Gillisia sp.]